MRLWPAVSWRPAGWWFRAGWSNGTPFRRCRTGTPPRRRRSRPRRPTAGIVAYPIRSRIDRTGYSVANRPDIFVGVHKPGDVVEAGPGDQSLFVRDPYSARRDPGVRFLDQCPGDISEGDRGIV